MSTASAQHVQKMLVLFFRDTLQRYMMSPWFICCNPDHFRDNINLVLIFACFIGVAV